MDQESLIMKLFTFARTRNECGGHGIYRDEERIERFGPHFPPVFLSFESAKAWQEKITNPLTNEDLLAQFHWSECHIVELELQAGLVTNVEKAAADLVSVLNSQCEKDEWLVDEKLKLLTQELAKIGMLQI